MICPFCKKRQATLHFIEIVEKKKMEIHICKTCAEEKGYIDGSNFTIGNLISSLISSASTDDKQSKDKEKEEVQGEVCEFCGSNWEDLRQSGRIGCANDYELFLKPIVQLLENTHGSSRHQGKIPSTTTGGLGIQRKIMNYQADLERALAEENYEQAASLRDKIKSIQQKKIEG